MSKEEFIKAIAEYFCITEDTNDYDWNSGCTIYGDDGEHRWMTLSNIMDALEDYLY